MNAPSNALPQLCYLVPRFDENSDEHFFHLYERLRKLAESYRLAVVIERCRGVAAFPGAAQVIALRWPDLPPLRIVEMLWLFLRLRLLGYRLFYVHYSFFGGIFWSLAARLCSAKVVYWHCVSEFFEKPLQFSRASLAHKLKAEWPLRLTMKLVHGLVTGTESVAAGYSERFAIPRSRISVIPNEVDCCRFAPDPVARLEARKALGIAPDAPVILFVHRLAERKGAHLLPEIASRVVSVRPKAVFVIAGGGPLRKWLETEFATRGLAASCRVLGAVSNRRIPSLCCAGDVYLMPSLEEGFPRALLEAMACGLPAVAAEVGGVREMTPPELAPWLVPVGDVEGLATRVLRLLEDGPARKALAGACRKHAQAYDSAAVLRILSEAIARWSE